MELLAGFSIGILGSAHCLGMCGPIALVLPAGERRGMQYYLGRVIYNLGRVVTYALLGLAAGFLGSRIALAGLQQGLTIALGVAVILGALVPSAGAWVAARWSPLTKLYASLTSGLGALLKRRSLGSLGLIGLLNGLLPCGLVYLAMAGAAATAGALTGMLFMTGFGAGTVPAMLAASLAAGAVPARWRSRLLRLVPAAMVVVGVLLILRGLNLGIPMISPVLSAGPHAGAACH